MSCTYPEKIYSKLLITIDAFGGMHMKSSSSFYENLNKIMNKKLENPKKRSILTSVDWDTEAARCHDNLFVSRNVVLMDY